LSRNEGWQVVLGGGGGAGAGGVGGGCGGGAHGVEAGLALWKRDALAAAPGAAIAPQWVAREGEGAVGGGSGADRLRRRSGAATQRQLVEVERSDATQGRTRPHRIAAPGGGTGGRETGRAGPQHIVVGVDAQRRRHLLVELRQQRRQLVCGADGGNGGLHHLAQQQAHQGAVGLLLHSRTSAGAQRPHRHMAGYSERTHQSTLAN